MVKPRYFGQCVLHTISIQRDANDTSIIYDARHKCVG